MTYVVRSTEKVRAHASDFETKAMLYLMNCRNDSDEIVYFIIDFFNDITGLNNYADKAWDIQSKAASNSSPKSVGAELVTLFKNFMSDLKFDYLILFLGGVSKTFRIDDSINIFDINNVTQKSKIKLKEGLFQEGTEKNYICNEWLTDENFNDFIEKVTFVIDDKSKSEYIKGLINVNQNYIPKDEVLDSIFNTIRDKQSAKKNTPSVEGETIERISDCFRYDRSIKTKEIRMMVLNTIINGNLIQNGAPLYFTEIIKNYDFVRRKDVIEDCQLQLSTLLFDKENSDQFWKIFELIYDTILNNKEKTVLEVYNLIADNPVLRNPRLEILTIQYLISVMKEVIDCENQKNCIW